MPTPSQPAPRRVERALAALAFGLPLWALATEISPRPWLLDWSKPLAGGLALYAAGYVALLASYRRPLGRLETLRSLGVALASCALLALVGFEFALRAADRPQFEALDNSGRHAPDPDVGHVYAPNHRQTLQSREFRALWTSNAQGVRAVRDFGPKPAGVARVLCVGDSFTACDQVDYEQSWPARLESCLNAALGAGRVEVVNCGFPGFGTADQARWIAKFAAQFEPDVVLLALTPNDLSENRVPAQYSARDGALVSSTSTAADARRYQRRQSWWRLAAAWERSRTNEFLQRSPLVRRLRGEPAYNHIEAFQVERTARGAALFELADACVLEARAQAARLGARFAAIAIPYRHQLRPLGPDLDGAVFGRHWEQFGAAQGFPARDALPHFTTHADPSSLHWREDTHCTAAGYELVARAACELLLEQRDALGLVRGAR